MAQRINVTRWVPQPGDIAKPETVAIVVSDKVARILFDAEETTGMLDFTVTPEEGIQIDYRHR